MIRYFWAIRSYIADADKPMSMAIIKDWQESCYINLERWERDCLFAMDGAFRRARMDVLKYHAERKQIKTGVDKDWAKANG